MLAGAALSLLPLAGCTQPAKETPVTFVEEPWTFGSVPGRKFTTDHFDIYSTLTDVELERALPAYLEAAHTQYTALLPAPADTKGGRLQTYVFNTRRQWETYSKQAFPHKYHVYSRITAGGFAEGNQCVTYYIQRMYTLSVLAHEGMHQYFGDHFDVALPAWLNEGLATYCEAFELPRNKPVFTPTHNTFRVNALREALAGKSLLPLQELLSTNAGRVIVQGQSRTTKAYYAEAWALVTFLQHGAEGKYAPGFRKMLDGIVSGELPTMAQAAKIRAPSPGETSFGEAVFRAYISEDLTGFDAEFRDYMLELAGFEEHPKAKGLQGLFEGR
jgi:hypothetical protein